MNSTNTSSGSTLAELTPKQGNVYLIEVIDEKEKKYYKKRSNMRWGLFWMHSLIKKDVKFFLGQLKIIKEVDNV